MQKARKYSDFNLPAKLVFTSVPLNFLACNAGKKKASLHENRKSGKFQTYVV